MLVWFLFRKCIKRFYKKSKLSLNCTVYDFPVNHSLVEEENIFNKHEYLMVKNNVK